MQRMLDKDLLDLEYTKNRASERNVLLTGCPRFRVGQGGGVVVYQYTRKKFANPKIPKIHPNIPKIIPRYTLYLKFKESDIPNTRI